MAPTVPTWTLADRLVKSRRHAGLDQQQMADRLEVSRPLVAKFEAGYPIRLAYVHLWAEVCDVPLDWLRWGIGCQHEPAIDETDDGTDTGRQRRGKLRWSTGQDDDDQYAAGAGYDEDDEQVEQDSPNVLIA